MLKPLTIGALTLPTNIIQGPLAGYSCSPFRQLIWQFGGVAYCTTEMLSANNIVHRPDQPIRYRERANNEAYWCVQLAGAKPEVLYQATQMVSEWGADIIDLNCGCPQPKIRKKQMGSALLSTPEQLYQCVSAMRSATDAALTVKIRVNPWGDDAWRVAVLNAIESAGADALIVHGRHWTERYDVPARWQEIAWFATNASIPVIANGDVSDYESFKWLLTQTRCDGVMVSRASVGKPWLFHAIGLQQNNSPMHFPDDQQQVDLLLTHVRELVRVDGEVKALLQARKLVAYYFPTVTLSDKQRENINALAVISDLEAVAVSLLNR